MRFALGGFGAPADIIWDAYFAFAGNAQWHAQPSGPPAAGGHHRDTNGPEQYFLPLLTSQYDQADDRLLMGSEFFDGDRSGVVMSDG